MGLSEYQRKRDFQKTPEPKAQKAKASAKAIFVVQKHYASRLHYDVRLEMEGVLKSWAVPKGPSLDPKVKRLAVEVEDHPLAYAQFEGTIPKNEYGAGKVLVWDRGHWSGGGLSDLKKGRLEFTLDGEKLKGSWVLIRTQKDANQWLLIKRHDEFARAEDDYDVTEAEPNSVLSKKTVTKIEVPEPQLATLTMTPPHGAEWIHELKYDGYRTLCRLQDGKLSLFTRSGLDWTAKYPKCLLEALASVQAKSFLLDGEVTWVDEEGRTNFGLLQKAMKTKSGERLVYYAFDLLYVNGRDLRLLPLVERKKQLRALLPKSGRLVYSEHFSEVGAELLQSSCQLGLEGILSKKAKSSYVSGRSTNWLKSKCLAREEFVVGGFSVSDRSGFRSLLVGQYEDGKLIYRGRVGTGFDARDLQSIRKQLNSLQVERCPFAKCPADSERVCWVRPQLVIEVESRGWSADGLLRQASFKGVRKDKPAKQVKPESVDLAVSNPEKVLYPEKKITKGQVAEYYAQMAPLILTYVKDRPLSLLRCPSDYRKSCFFQKHLEKSAPGLGEHSFTGAKGEENVWTLQSERGLHSLAQLGTLEIHVWQTRARHIESPDQMVFDLDPDESVSWRQVKDSAFEIREFLEELGLPSYLKLTGGKGVHLHVPIVPRYGWELVKSFSQTVVLALAQRQPTLYTTQMLKARRKGKIFLDYLRNGYGATAVAPYSLRANASASVALPLAWDELKAIRKPDQWTLSEVLRAFARGRPDPWVGAEKNRAKIALLEAKEFRRFRDNMLNS